MAQKKNDNKSNVVKWIGIVIIAIAVIYMAVKKPDELKKIVTDYLSDTVVTEEVDEVNDNNVETNEQEVNGNLKIYFFDVGQADCILVENNGHYMMIDAGNNADGKLIVEQLAKMGITKLDYLVGTHPHEDHIGGLDNVIDAVDVGKLYMPKRTADNKTYESVLDSVAKKKMKISTPKRGDTFYVGSAFCKVMSVESDADDTNNSSIVIEMTYGEKKFLFMGDAEKPIESKYEWNDVDVLKVGHHGSRNASSKNFLDTIKPEYAIISCGIGNDYGHPHSEAITRLTNAKSKIYRTDEKGTIVITCDGEHIRFSYPKICLNR